jgi:hypothetical protein
MGRGLRNHGSFCWNKALVSQAITVFSWKMIRFSKTSGFVSLFPDGSGR